MTWSVHDEPDFERVYDEDDIIPTRRGDLRALLDICTQSMDFSSGFMCNEEVEIMRATAAVLGIAPCVVTPPNFRATYKDEHVIEAWDPELPPHMAYRCTACGRYGPTREEVQ